MVISIDAVHCGAAAGRTEHWQTKIADYVLSEEPRQGQEVMAPARGILCGLVLSVGLWIGLVATAHALLTMMR